MDVPRPLPGCMACRCFGRRHPSAVQQTEPPPSHVKNAVSVSADTVYKDYDGAVATRTLYESSGGRNGDAGADHAVTQAPTVTQAPEPFQFSPEPLFPQPASGRQAQVDAEMGVEEIWHAREQERGQEYTVRFEEDRPMHLESPRSNEDPAQRRADGGEAGKGRERARSSPNWASAKRGARDVIKVGMLAVQRC